ncbi:unnamed protein product [Pylaiella littoralis]
MLRAFVYVAINVFACLIIILLLRTTSRGGLEGSPCALLQSRAMATESEVLLRAAAAIAAYETGAAGGEEQQDDVGVINLTIRGRNNGKADRSFLVDLVMGNVAEVGGRDSVEGERAVAAAVSRARLHLIYASEDVFLELARKHIDPRVAVLAGKLFFSGEMALGVNLGYWLRKAVEQGVAAAAALESATLGVVEADRWERDGDVGVCGGCGQQGVKGRQNALEGNPSASGAREEALRREEAGVARNLQTLVLELEEEVDNIDKRTFKTRAWVLRHVVLTLYRVISLALLAMVLLGAHCGATFLSRQVGPKVAIDGAPLSAFVGGGSAGTGAKASPRGDDADAHVNRVPNNRIPFTGRAWPTKDGLPRPPRDDGAPAATTRNLKLRVSPAVYWAIMALVVVCLREHHRRTRGVLLRRVKTFCLAGTFIFVLKMTQKFTQGMSLDDSAKTWEDTHKLLAPYVYRSILDIAGMWVKTGQYLSSRADVMPQPYIDELCKLQDSVPASPFDEVDQTVKEQLGRPLSELFATVEREALASASVAQVHRCTLKDGRKAVVKVQHRRVRRLFLEDLQNISRLVRMVAWAEKDYDFRPIIDEWAEASHGELDFVCEAANLLRIAASMKRSGLNVIIPELIPEFTRTKVVVMTFCEGFKVTDSKSLAAAELDREGVMRAVTESFAYQQIHIDGLFNGDPHPGNILLQPASRSSLSIGGSSEEGARSAAPVLLDWGLVKTLPEHLRIAFSRFVYAACEHDFVSMLVAFEEMGIKLNRFDPAEDMHNIRFLLRDTQPASEAKEDSARFHKMMRKRRGKELKNPVDAYPGDLLFFFRVHALLRGLATRLNVRQKHMDIMAPYAKQALREVVPEAEHATRVIYPSPLLSTVDTKVRRALEGLIETGKITGCQVSVIYRGKTLVDLCAGTQGPVDPRPVRPCTLFCVFSAGKAVCATAVHLLADRGLLHYDQLLSELWPEFARNGKEPTTVRHVLTHTTGLQHAFPDKATFDRICDWEETKKVLEEAEPAWSPGSRASYHYFTFGWLVAAVVEKASGVPFGQARCKFFVREEIATPLGVEDSFFMGGLSACGVETSRIAHVEHTFKIPDRSGTEFWQDGRSPSPAARASTQAAGNGGSKGRDSGGNTAAMVGFKPSAGSRQSVAGGGGVVETESLDEDIDDEGVPRLERLAAMASGLKETDPEEGAAVDGLARKLAGREYFLDPRVFNHPQMRDACMPAANGHFTAKALATLYDNFLVSLGIHSTSSHTTANNRRKRHGNKRSGDGDGDGDGDAASHSSPLLRRARVNEMRSYQVKETSSLHLLFGLPKRGVRYSLGYQMFGFREKPPRQQRQRQRQQKQQRQQRQLLQAAPFEAMSSIGTATVSLTIAGDASETTWVVGGSPQRGRRGAAAGRGGEMPLAAASERGRSLTDATGFGDDANGPFFGGAAPSLLAGGSLYGGRGAASVGGRGDGDGDVDGGGRRDALGDDAPAGGRVRLSGFGHVGLGGSLALCDPASGLAFAMVTNKVGTGRESSSAVLTIVCEELGIGDPSHFFED